MNAVLPGGQRACKHCGRASRDHTLAMTEKRCPDVVGAHYEPMPDEPEKPRKWFRGSMFDAEETEAMVRLFEAITRGADVKPMLKRAPIVSARKKFAGMLARMMPNGGQ